MSFARRTVAFFIDCIVINVIAIIFVLLFGIAGLVKGFLKQILSVANGLGSIIISCLILTPATNLAMNTPLGDMVNDKVLEVVVEKYPQTAEVPLSLIEETEDMSIVFEEAGLSKIASKIASEFINLDKVSSDAYLSDAIAEGIGEKLTQINKLPYCYIVIAIGDTSVSTKWAFEELDKKENRKNNSIY